MAQWSGSTDPKDWLRGRGVCDGAKHRGMLLGTGYFLERRDGAMEF